MSQKRPIPAISRAQRRKICGTLILVPIGVWFALREIYLAYAPVAERPNYRDTDSVVALPNGGTLLEPRGTAGRNIVDWLDTHQNGNQAFEVGGNQFLGDTAELTPESVGRISQLAAMLKADRNVRTAIVGYSAIEADGRLSQTLSVTRARRVRDELIRFGVPTDRITAEGRGSSDPIAPNDTATGRKRNERVAVFLSHHSSGSID